MSCQRTVATLLVSLLLLPGCLSDETSENPEIEDCSTIIGDSCESEDTTGGEEAVEEEISISGNSFCDNTNPDHCLLPFPSSAFLNSDSGTITGYRLDIDGRLYLDSASAESEDFHMLNSKDGHSPSSQIFTTFTSIPNISGLLLKTLYPPHFSPDTTVSS